MTSSRKNSNSELLNFFSRNYSRRLSEFFEGLNSSLAQSAGDLRRLVKISKCTFCMVFSFCQKFIFEL